MSRQRDDFCSRCEPEAAEEALGESEDASIVDGCVKCCGCTWEPASGCLECCDFCTRDPEDDWRIE